MTQSTLQRLRPNLYLDKKNGWVAGVCAGIARRMRVDPAIVRVAAIVSGLFLPKLVVAAYLVAWLVLEDRPV